MGMATKRQLTPKAENVLLKKRLSAREKEHKRALKVQSALYKIADAASAAKDLPSFYKKVHRIVGGLMYAKSFYVILYDAEGDLIGVDDGYFADAFGDPKPAPGPLAQYAMTPSAVVLMSGKTMHLPREKMDEMTDRGILKPIGSNAVDWIGVPLKDKKNAFGVVVIQSYEEGVTYSEEDVKLLEFVAQHIATALIRVRALEETRQRTNELAILNSVGEAMSKTLDVKTVAKLVGDKVRDIFNADVSIMLFDSRANLIHNVYEFDRGEGGYIDYLDEPIPLGKGLTSRIIQTHQPLLLGTVEEQISNGAYIPPEMEANASGVIAPSWLGAPIVAGDKVLGSVNLSVYQEHAFHENDLRLLKTLAANMGVANYQLRPAGTRRRAGLPGGCRLSRREIA
jgi:GAF domain-containing protein